MGEILKSGSSDSNSDWDSLQQDVPFYSNEKSSPDEYAELKDVETKLRNNCDHYGNAYNECVQNGVKGICQNVFENYEDKGNDLISSLEAAADGSRNYNNNTINALLDTIDTFYPSRFGNNNPSTSKEEAKQNYNYAINGSEDFASIKIGDVARCASAISDFENVNIPDFIERIKNTKENEQIFAKRMVDYLDEPSDEKLEEIKNTFGAKTEAVKRDLFDISRAASEANQSDLSDIVHQLNERYGEARDDVSRAIFEYLDFKIDHASTSDDLKKQASNILKTLEENPLQ